MGPIGEAFVRVHADTRGMKGEVERGTKGAFAGIGKTLAGIGIGVGAFEFFKTAVKDAADEQRALESLQTAVKASGAAWVVNGQSIEDTLNKMEIATGTGLPELAQGFLRLVTATGDSKLALRDLGLAQDISVARHLGLAQASVILARAEGGSDTALRRLGIIIPKVSQHYDSLKKQVEQAVASGIKFSKAQQLAIKAKLDDAKALDKQASKQKIIQTIQQRFGGQTEKFAKTAAGSYARLRESIKNVMEDIGKSLLPGLTRSALGVQRWIEALRKSPKFVNGLKGAVGALGEAFHIAGTFIQAVGPTLLQLASAAGDAAKAIGAPALITAVAVYKGLSIAVGLVTTAQAKLAASSTAQVAGENAVSAAQAKATATTAALTVALEANTVAAAENATVLRVQGITTLGTFATTAAKAETAAVGVGTAVGRTSGIAARAGGALATVGRGALAMSGGWQTLAVVGVAALVGAIVFLATEEGKWERATRNAASAVRDLGSALGRAKQDAQDLAHAKLDVTMARTAVAAARLAVEQDKHNLAVSTAKKGTLEYRQLQLALKQDQEGLRNAQLGVTDAIKRQVDEQHKAKKGQAEITAERGKAIDKIVTLKGLADQEVARLKQALQFERSRQGAAGMTAAARIRDAKVVDAVEQQGLKKFVEKLNDVQRATEKNAPGVAHNVTLLKQFAEATGKVPTKKEIRIALDNKDANLSLLDFLSKLSGLGDKGAKKLLTGRAKLRNAGLDVGAAFGAGVIQGIQSTLQAQALIAAALAPINAAIAGINAALESSSPSKKTAREIGVPFIEGVSVGIEKGSKKAEVKAAASVLKVAGAAVAAIKSPAIRNALSDGLGAAFTDAFASNQLQSTIQDAVKTAVENVTSAVNSAKQNLSSIGSSIASSINDVIDKRFANMENQAAKVPAALRKRYAAIKAEIAAGDMSPELARRAQSLAHEIQASAAASATATSTNLDKKKASIERIINDAVTLFNLGRITGAQLEARINAQLRRAGILTGGTSPAAGGRAAREGPGATPGQIFTGQGITVTTQLRELIGALHAQTTAIKQGPRLPGGGFAPDIVKPLDTLREEQKNIAQAAAGQRDQILQAQQATAAATKQTAAHTKKTAEKAAQAAAAAEATNRILGGGKGKDKTKTDAKTNADHGLN